MKGFSILAHYKAEFCKPETKSKLFLTKLNHFQKSQGQVNKNKTNVSLPATSFFGSASLFYYLSLEKLERTKTSSGGMPKEEIQAKEKNQETFRQAK